MEAKSLNILFISLYYKPVWPGFGTRYAELLTDETAKIGHNVTMMTGRISKSLNVDKKFYQLKHTESIGNGQVTTMRFWTPNLKHEGFFNRTFTYFLFLLQCYFKILTSTNFDVLMALHPYPPFFYPFLLLCKLKKIKFILNVTDLWPDNLLELNIIKNIQIYNLIKYFCVSVYNKSTKVIVTNDELKKQISKYFKNPSTINILQSATNTDIFQPVKIQNNPYNEKFVIMYAGIFSPNYDFKIILDSAKLLQNYPNILFVLSGAGESKENILNKIKKYKISNVIIENPVDSIFDVVNRLNQADVLIMGMNDNEQSYTGTPSKIFEYMACKKPVICSTRGATEKLLNESNGGLIVKPHDSQAFTDAILSLYNNQNLSESLALNGYNFINKFHNLENFRKKLNSIICS